MPGISTVRLRLSNKSWLTDDPAAGDIKVGYLGKGVGPRLSRADLAAFMLEQAEDPTYVCQAPVISSYGDPCQKGEAMNRIMTKDLLDQFQKAISLVRFTIGEP